MVAAVSPSCETGAGRFAANARQIGVVIGWVINENLEVLGGKFLRPLARRFIIEAV